MCGRYRLSRRKQILEEYFHITPWDDDWNPRYNIAPTQSVPVIRQNPSKPVREISLMKWGLIPHWSNDPSIAMSTINAKSETAATKPAFRDPIRFRRCLIPADGFYEWQRRGSSKQPYCFEVNEGELFDFAGLWDGWKGSNANWVKTCSILTTTPNALASSVHDRMPVILRPDQYEVWHDPAIKDVGSVSELLKPYDALLMRCYPVSTRVNHVANDDEECSQQEWKAEAQIKPDELSLYHSGSIARRALQNTNLLLGMGQIRPPPAAARNGPVNADFFREGQAEAEFSRASRTRVRKPTNIAVDHPNRSAPPIASKVPISLHGCEITTSA